MGFRQRQITACGPSKSKAKAPHLPSFALFCKKDKGREAATKSSTRQKHCENVPGAGDTIIEKLEKLTKADFACVLVTPDDEGRKRASPGNGQLRPRARQNVVLELGMVLACLGRSRVAILVKGEGDDLERPSDIDGLLYIPFKNHVNEAKNPLASNLQKAGFSIQIADLSMN